MNAERYNRQIILDGFGEQAQLRLSQARILVIGAGGLGCPALQYFTAAGAGHIGIADDDRISLSNLHRQILFTTDDIGKYKVDVAAKRLGEMNPEVKISVHRLKISQSNILEILQNYEVVFDGTDNFESRYLINDACTLLGKPLVFAAVSGYQGQLTIFNVMDEKHNSCNYRDLFPVPPEPGEVRNCAENGVLGVLPGIIGTMAAAEAIKLITGTGTPLINKLLHYDALTCSQYVISLTPGADYTLPKTAGQFWQMKYHDPVVREIDYLTMQQLQHQPSTILIDVRERDEVPRLNNEVFMEVPMSEFRAFLESDITALNIVFVCQHGIRSIHAAEVVNKKYGNTRKLYSLKGGVAEWMHLL